MRTEAYHGGEFFSAIGEDFRTLERSTQIINADVLDAWFNPSPRVLSVLREHLAFLLRTSPPIYAAGVIEKLAELRGVPPECFLLGAGSSDLIFTCLPRLIERGSRVLLLDPTYSEYEHVCRKVIGTNLVRHVLSPQNSFRFRAEDLRESIRSQQPDTVILVNPNSPTGRHLSRTEMQKLIESLPGNIRLVVDETYIEYVGAAESVERLVIDHPNLLVIKSMSKVYALSGARVAYLVAAPAVADQLARFLPPWAVSLPAQVAAVEALDDPAYYTARYEETHSLRAEAVDRLRTIPGTRVYDTDLNFYLLQTEAGLRGLVQKLKASGIFVRNFDNRFLRISVKSSEQNHRIIDTIERCLPLG
jgi:histidinol-phosphate/aromatic aminotransferase/cobyric acid decarboxylase-like protein